MWFLFVSWLFLGLVEVSSPELNCRRLGQLFEIKARGLYEDRCFEVNSRKGSRRILISSESFSGLATARRILWPRHYCAARKRAWEKHLSLPFPAYSQTGCSGLAPAPELWDSGCRNLALRAFVNKPRPSSTRDLQGAKTQRKRSPEDLAVSILYPHPSLPGPPHLP